MFEITASDWFRSDRFKKVAAFAAIYFVWGSTYLAIRLLADTLPAFIMVGLRFLLAGLALFLYARLRGVPNPSALHWRTASTSGVILLALGTGGVVWGVQHMDSGVVALLVATEPLWLALLIWLWPGGRRPSLATFGALGLGFVGAAILAAPGGGTELHLGAVVTILAACLAWGVGSLYSRTADLPTSPLMTTSIQMLAGGVALAGFGLVSGELQGFELRAVSATSVLAFAYLVIFGSLVAFSAFSWLIRTTDPTLVSTHTYVNPVVAVFLGWWIVGESIGPRTLVASALILASVFLVTTASGRREQQSRAVQPTGSKPAERSQDGAGRKLERCA